MRDTPTTRHEQAAAQPLARESRHSRHAPASAEPAHGFTAGDVVDAYRRYAPLYDWVFGAVLEPGRRALAAAVCRENPGTLLEVGVGTGLLLPHYPAQAKVTGIDLSQAMLDKARQRAGQLPGRDIRLMRSNGETLSFAANAFDCVTLPYVLSVTPDPARLIGEALRVCRAGGSIFVVNHFSGSRTWWLLERLVRPLAARIGFRSDFSLQEQILDHGWQIESIRTVNLFGLSRLIHIRNR